MIRRWTFSILAAIFLLLACLVQIFAAGPIDAPRPWKAGGVVARTPPGYTLTTDSGLEIPPIAPARHASTLARLSVSRAPARFWGVRYDHAFRPYLIVESIEETP